jgi:hypothetical protein
LCRQLTENFPLFVAVPENKIFFPPLTDLVICCRLSKNFSNYLSDFCAVFARTQLKKDRSIINYRTFKLTALDILEESNRSIKCINTIMHQYTGMKWCREIRGPPRPPLKKMIHTSLIQTWHFKIPCFTHQTQYIL